MFEPRATSGAECGGATPGVRRIALHGHEALGPERRDAAALIEKLEEKA
jgi:hypothetical protein